MIDKNKIEKLIQTMLEKEAYFQDGHWSSSQNFDNELRKHGFIPPVPLYHKYKFPSGFTEESFEQFVMAQIYFYFFDTERITNPKSYVDKYFQYAEEFPYLDIEAEKKAYLFKILSITGPLSKEEKEYLSNYFANEKAKSLGNLASYLDELKNLNPEIKDININPNDIFRLTDLYIGMTSRFHYEDIKYFCSINNMDQATIDQENIQKATGINPNFRIAPYRAKKIIEGITIQKQKMSNRDI
jgi:hypothetical protein